MEGTDYLVGMHYVCPRCKSEKAEWAWSCCFNPELVPVRYYDDFIESQIGHDGYLIYLQCQNCGQKKGTALKKKDHPKEKTPTFNYYLDEKRLELQSKFCEIKKKIDKIKSQGKYESFRENYFDYIYSDEWEAKKKLVFERDNHICQECKKNSAEQVHHLTYKNFKNENLDELISVCVNCHHKIHNIE
jgi:5-methylcytosine-specific restriction endonuclease McrA